MAALLSAGCDTGPRTFSVEGTVSYQGNNLTRGIINFRGPDGQIAGGSIGPDGTFEYPLVAGDHQVRISVPLIITDEMLKDDSAIQSPPKPEIPKKYGNYGSSGLTATVSGEEDPQTIDFSLE